MKIGNINSSATNQSFRGILKFDKKIEETNRLYKKTIYQYNYYPFEDESEKEIKNQEKIFNMTTGKKDFYWDGYVMMTGELCGGQLRHNFNVKERLPITADKYIGLKLMGISDTEILRKSLKKNSD